MVFSTWVIAGSIIKVSFPLDRAHSTAHSIFGSVKARRHCLLSRSKYTLPLDLSRYICTSSISLLSYGNLITICLPSRKISLARSTYRGFILQIGFNTGSTSIPFLANCLRYLTINFNDSSLCLSVNAVPNIVLLAILSTILTSYLASLIRSISGAVIKLAGPLL